MSAHPRMKRVSGASAEPMQFTKVTSHTPQCSVAARRVGSPTDRPTRHQIETNLRSLSDEELLSWFRSTRNDLTTTVMEEVLAERLAEAIDRVEDTADLEKEIEQMTETNSDLSSQITALEDEIYDLKQSLKE